jgi:hypothetical protein
MWYLNQSGATEGPLSEAQIVEMIRFGGLREGHVCPVGATEWLLLAGHPAFAQALTGIEPTMMAMPEAQPQAQQLSPYGPPQGGAAPALHPYGAPQGGAAPASHPYGAPQGGAPGPAAVNPYGAPQGTNPYGPPQGGAPQGSYAPNPHGAPPQGAAPGYAPNQYGAPQGAAPGYAANPYGAPQQQQQGFPPAAKSKLPLFLGLGGAGLVVTAALGTGAYFALRSSGPTLAKAMPAGTQIYVEATGVKEALVAAKRMNFIDSSKYDDKKSLEDAQLSFSKAFELSATDAAIVALGIRGAAGGGWNVGRSGTSSAFLLSWDSATSAKILLSSKRFSPDGTIASGAVYKVARRDIPYEQMRDMPAAEKTLSQMSTSGRSKLVWFEKAKVMAVGDEASLRDVAAVIDGAPSLAKSELYIEAKGRFASGAQLVAFIDPQVMRESSRAVYDKYFAAGGPMSLSASAESEGIKMKYAAALGGPEILKQKDAYILEPSKLELARTLPQETVGFLDMSTKVAKRGKEGRALLIRALSAQDGGSAIQQEIEKAEKELGIDIGDVLTALGDEAIVGVIARAGYTYTPKVPPGWKDFAVVYEQKLEDEAAAKKIVTTLKNKASDAPIKITMQGDNFVGEPATDGGIVPRIEVRYLKKKLFMVLGSQALAERVFAAADGTLALGDDKAFKNAVSATEGKNAMLWFDTGRAAQTYLDAEPTIKTEANKAGVPLDSLILTGDKRMTSTLGITTEFKGDKLVVSLDSVNLPMVGGAVAAASMLRLSSALGAGLPDPQPSTQTPTAAGGSMPKVCEDYFAHYQRCMQKAGLSAAQAGKTVSAIRDTYSRIPAASLVSICITADTGVTKSFKNCQ